MKITTVGIDLAKNVFQVHCQPLSCIRWVGHPHTVQALLLEKHFTSG